MKGVAYQRDYSGNGTSSQSTSNAYTDPLADTAACQRDIPYLQRLNTNTIRVYAIDPTKNHDTCMNALANAGIYVIADLSAPGLSIIRDNPAWNDDLYSRYTAVVDNLQKYTNTLGFFAGNEVSNQANNTAASAFVKAAVRDTKAYIAQKGYRSIGVGYATSDDQYIRDNIGKYFDCGDRSVAVDFLGYNIYSWCGESTFQESGYADRTAQFQNYNVPVFFAEYGCNTVRPRTFQEVGTLYGPEMTGVWSGGIVYMYFQETNDYGLVTLNGNSVSTLADFNALSSQMASISPTILTAAQYTPTNTAAQQCPSVSGGVSGWAATTKLPPTPNKQLCQCMYNALSCVPNNVDQSNYGTLFGYICGQVPAACAGIQANGTTGTYGAYEMCNSREQLGWALNAYYLAQRGSNPSACGFSGSASLRSAASATGSCSSLIAQAGPQGTGTVTSGPSSTGGAGGSSSGSVASQLTGPPSFVPASAIIAYVVLALFSGAGMILL